MLGTGLLSSKAEMRHSQCRWIVGSVLAVGLIVLGVTLTVQFRSASTEIWQPDKSWPKVMVGAAKFERLEHFKDYGLPGTTADALARGSIAFAVCMLYHIYPAGLYNPKNTAEADAILSTVAGLPSRATPSHMVLTADKILPSVCKNQALLGGDEDLEESPFESVYGSLDNWHHALCAKHSDPSWGGVYDPAYEPQQAALTMGLHCSFVCDLVGGDITYDFLDILTNESPYPAVEALCKQMPWGEGYTGAKTFSDLKAIAAKLKGSICQCSF